MPGAWVTAAPRRWPRRPPVTAGDRAIARAAGLWSAWQPGQRPCPTALVAADRGQMSDSSDSVTGTTARQAQVLAGHAGFLVTTAARAPSVHNTQPWRFRTGPDAVEVWGDPRRKLRTDPLGREMLISCGAAVFGLRLAVRSLGYWPVTELLPDPARLRLLARVSIGAAAPATGLERQMLDAVPHRHTHRGPFGPARCPPGCWPACSTTRWPRAPRSRWSPAAWPTTGWSGSPPPRPAAAISARAPGPRYGAGPGLRPARHGTASPAIALASGTGRPRGGCRSATSTSAAASPGCPPAGIPARHRRVADPRRPPRGLAARRAGPAPDAAARRQPAGLRLPAHPAAGGRAARDLIGSQLALPGHPQMLLQLGPATTTSPTARRPPAEPDSP